MACLRRLAAALAKALAVTAALGLLILVLLLVVDLFGRNLFGFTTTFANEWSSFVNGAVIMLAAPLALLKGDHIRVELVLMLRSRRLRRILTLLADAICVLVAAYLCYAIAAMAWESLVNDRRSTWVMRTPLWIPQAALAAGAAALVLAALHHLLSSFVSTGRGR